MYDERNPNPKTDYKLTVAFITGDKTKTPIEIALAIDNEGMTTARKLYDFLELNPAHYARWAKNNIEENMFAVENIDFMRFVINDETYLEQ